MSTFLIAIIPIIIFALIDTFGNLKYALIGMIIATLLEIGYSLYTFGHIDTISLLSVLLVIVLAWLAYKQQKGLIIKLKPAILNGTFGAYMVISYLFNKPLLLNLVTKYPQLIPQKSQAIIQSSIGILILTKLSIALGISLLIYAAIIAWSAIKHSSLVWGIVNVIGLCLSMFLPILWVFSTL